MYDIEFYIQQTNSIQETALILQEKQILFELAKNCTGSGCIVEIGTLYGGSAIMLGGGSKSGNNVPVFAIDPYAEPWFPPNIKDLMKENLKRAQVDDIVTHIQDTSENAAKSFNRPIELLWIDGDHRYQFVKKDFNLWFPKLIVGGTIAFHDSIPKWKHYGVVRLCDEIKPQLKNVRYVQSIMIGEKP